MHDDDEPVDSLPTPKRKTRKPKGILAHLLDFGVFVVVLVLSLLFLTAALGQELGLGVLVVILVVLAIAKAAR